MPTKTQPEQPAIERPAAPAGEELLTDSELASLLRVGNTKLFEIQKRPDFPAPIWLGPRLKRHQKVRVMAWALSQHRKPVEAA